MKRSLFSLVTAISLLATVAVLMLWIRSYWTCDSVVGESLEILDSGEYRGFDLNVGSMWGVVHVWHYMYRSDIRAAPPAPRNKWAWVRSPAVDPKVAPRHWHYYWPSYTNNLNNSPPNPPDEPFGTRERTISISLPDWIVVIFTCAIPVWWLIGARKRKREQTTPGLCPQCGYDLRGSADRCPECGTPIPAGKSGTPAGPPAPDSASAETSTLPQP
jgi:hypothetical protein